MNINISIHILIYYHQDARNSIPLADSPVHYSKMSLKLKKSRTSIPLAGSPRLWSSAERPARWRTCPPATPVGSSEGGRGAGVR